MTKSKSKSKSNVNIICQDALKYLEKQPKHSIPNMITGIPDMEETGLNYQKYYDFFIKAVKLCLTRTHKKGYTIFMNTDRKYMKNWIDKSFWIQKAADELPPSNRPQLKWHKILLLRPANSTHIQRPTYQHYLCFSYEKGPGEATPDVMLCGKKNYKNAACSHGTIHALNFIKKYSFDPKSVADPFVGRGTILLQAKLLGFTDLLGIDLDPEQCKITQKVLEVSKSQK